MRGLPPASTKSIATSRSSLTFCTRRCRRYMEASYIYARFDKAGPGGVPADAQRPGPAREVRSWRDGRGTEGRDDDVGAGAGADQLRRARQTGGLRAAARAVPGE